MNGLIAYVKSISFPLGWIFMSPSEQYACLWARTKKLGDLGYTVKCTPADTDN
jgi:hypothetical protein